MSGFGRGQRFFSGLDLFRHASLAAKNRRSSKFWNWLSVSPTATPFPTNQLFTDWLMGIYFIACELSHFSCIQLSMTLWTAPLSTGFSRQEHWSELPCPPPGDLPDPGAEPVSLMSPTRMGASSHISFCRQCRVNSPTSSGKVVSSTRFLGFVISSATQALVKCTHALSSATGTAIPRTSYPKEVLYASVIFQMHPF